MSLLFCLHYNKYRRQSDKDHRYYVGKPAVLALPKTMRGTFRLRSAAQFMHWNAPDCHNVKLMIMF